MKGMSRFWLSGFAFVLPFAAAFGPVETALADSIDEAALFADTSSIRLMQDTSAGDRGGASKPADGRGRAVETGSSQANSPTDPSRLSVTGSVLTYAASGLQRAYFVGPDIAETDFNAGAVADARFEARLMRGFRAMGTFEASHGGEFRVPELFLDAPIAHRLYLRMGKQVLQWGRCQFFNPTDLINVEANSFFQRIGNREGAFGLKAHAPIGVRGNLYAYVDMQGPPPQALTTTPSVTADPPSLIASRPDSLRFAFKAEALVGRTEMAASVLASPHRDAIYGFDFSSRLLGLDLAGEWALHQGIERRKLSLDEGAVLPWFVSTHDDWVSQAAFGASRAFTVNGIPDRLLILGEYFFNGAGTAQKRLPWPSGEGNAAELAEAVEPLLNAALTSGAYRPNAYARHYAALFTTFSRFVRDDIDLLANAIANINQQCAQISAGLSYRDLNDFSLTFYLNGFVGGGLTEYTFSGQALQAQLLAKVVF
jgi:hypothetical protein